MRWADCTRVSFIRPELCRVFLNEHLTGTAIASQAYGDELALAEAVHMGVSS